MQYNLGEKIQDGGEGVVYKVQGYNDLVIKIYCEKDKDGNVVKTPELFKKLQWMVENQPQDLVTRGILAWPIALYFGTSLNKDFESFQGFVMPRLDFDVSLENAYAYKHPTIDSRRGYDKYISNRARIEIAINLCSVFCEIQQRGFVIGDFNKDNIGVQLKDRKIVIMDCDSFHLVDQLKSDKFRCNRVMGGYLAPEIIEHCDLEKAAGRAHTLDKINLVTFTKESDNFCLAVHIFNLLMNGIHPYEGINQGIHGSTNRPLTENNAIKRFAYVFRGGKEPYAEFCLPRHALPEDIADYFDLAFIVGHKVPSQRPTSEEWYKRLSDYLDRVKNCSENSKHQYYREFKMCPYCIADIRHEQKTKDKSIINFPKTFVTNDSSYSKQIKAIKDTFTDSGSQGSQHVSIRQRNKVGLLGLFLGPFGVHNFYLGGGRRRAFGLIELVCSLLGAVLGSYALSLGIVWGYLGVLGLLPGYLEGICILAGKKCWYGDNNMRYLSGERNNWKIIAIMIHVVLVIVLFVLSSVFGGFI